MQRLGKTLLAAALLLAVCPLPLAAQVPAGAAQDIVVVISFDGMRHDYLDRGITPNFARVERAGMRADALIPVFPSKTFPNHHSIATGMYADGHGMVGNEFFDPELGEFSLRGPREGKWFGGEPIWITAERQGVRTAAFFWVGSELVIGGGRPTYWKVYDSGVLPETRIDTVLAWLSLPADRRPRLIMMYMELMDAAGHTYGPDAPQTDSALLRADTLLGRLLDGITRTPVAAHTHVIVLSDHGMTATDPARRVVLDSLADLSRVRVVGAGAYSTLYFEGDTVGRETILAGLRRLAHVQVFTRASIPGRFRWQVGPRIPDVLILPDDGWSVVLRSDADRVQAGGAHGYDPALASMRGVFLAMGPRIAAGRRIAAFENVHVYPLIAELLRITPAPAIDGRAEVLAPVLR